MNSPVHNEPSANNAVDFRMLAFAEPANERGKERFQQVNPTLRLPA
jgi:hypothetical protein